MQQPLDIAFGVLVEGVPVLSRTLKLQCSFKPKPFWELTFTSFLFLTPRSDVSKVTAIYLVFFSFLVLPTPLSFLKSLFPLSWTWKSLGQCCHVIPFPLMRFGQRALQPVVVVIFLSCFVEKKKTATEEWKETSTLSSPCKQG